MKLKVALFPQNIIWGNKEANLKTIEKTLCQLHPDTELLILPETFSTGFPSGDKEQIRPLAERNSGETMEFIRAMAKKYQLAICGSFIADSGGSLYNRAFFIEPGGEETFADKRHLFTMAGEHHSFSRGYDRLSVRYRGWNISMVICYDIRFPVWCRNVRNQYDVLIAVANWPKVRVDAWNKLLYARAIENECYVLGVDCNGLDSKGFEYDGSSVALDFKGKEIGVKIGAETNTDCEYDQSNLIIYATLDKERLDKFREKFPAWNDADVFNIETN
ncbi:MAG: nitrilase family protein [Prevotella sp.]|nr:nitrilase family protein [Bacteroides sp.]MCM1366419.1 nitrilase family protein [Prevotella sp.]